MSSTGWADGGDRMSGGSTVARVSAGVAGGAVLISVITIAARATGILRQLTFTRTVGLTCLNSVYTTANTVPNIVFEVVAGGALSAAVVPAVAAGAVPSAAISRVR